MALQCPSYENVTLCDTYESAAKAARKLSCYPALILHCEGHHLGMPDGSMSLIAIGDMEVSQLCVFDVLALRDKTHPLLIPLLELLSREDLPKLVWDSRPYLIELVETYAVIPKGFVDLQIAEVAERAPRLAKRKTLPSLKDWRSGQTLRYFKTMEAELRADPRVLDGIHKLHNLHFCAMLYQVTGQGAGDDKSTTKFFEEHGRTEAWNLRPAPNELLQACARTAAIVAGLVQRFKEKRGYIDDLEAVSAMSARYMEAYPSCELLAAHVSLDVYKFVPLEVLTAPPEHERRYTCQRCERILTLSCFAVSEAAREEPHRTESSESSTSGSPAPAAAGWRRTICRLCYLIARRKQEPSGTWVETGDPA